MAMGLNEASDNDMGTSSEVDPSMGGKLMQTRLNLIILVPSYFDGYNGNLNSFFLSASCIRSHVFFPLIFRLQPCLSLLFLVLKIL